MNLADTSTASNVFLPPFLFEEIIAKSKELCWLISCGDLERCFLFRDALRWENIKVSLINDSNKALNSAGNIKYPLKNLSLHVPCVDDGVIQHISALGETLMSLKISYTYGSVLGIDAMMLILVEFLIKQFPLEF